MKTMLIVLAVLVGIIVVYAVIVTFAPGFSVPPQPLEGLNKGGDTPPGRSDVEFEVNDVTVRAWLYRPEDLAGQVPCIVMANGLGGTKDLLLEQYALRFREAGCQVLSFDYRHFGTSDGEPRQLIWIPYQLEDWTAAVRFARGLEGVDPKKIFLWGTSLAGGHVIVTAANDQKVAGVMSQCPGLDGRASAEALLDRLGWSHILRMLVHGQRDIFRSWLGLSPHKIPIFGEPGSLALMNMPETGKFGPAFPPTYVNEACARIILRGDGYRPVKFADRVRCPVLLQICDQDEVTPSSAAEETKKNLGDYAEVKHYPIGHFDIYFGEHFEKAVADQLAFLRKNI